MKNLRNYIPEIIEHYIIKKTFFYDLIIKFKWSLKYKFPLLFATPSLNKLILMPHRKFLVQEISKEKNLKSIFEYGCGYGPNLILLNKCFKNGVELIGCDLSESLINNNNIRSKRNIENIKYLYGDIDWLKSHKRKYDFVLLDSVTMYISPKIIKDLFLGIHKITRKKAIVTVWQQNAKDEVYYWTNEFEWIYDYRILIEDLFRYEIKYFPENIWNDERWVKYGAILYLEPKKLKNY